MATHLSPRLVLVLGCVLCAPAADLLAQTTRPASRAWKTVQPMTAVETRQFMRRLAQYVIDHHMKKDEKSEQRGMTYEYFDTSKKGQYDQWVQGEALDTMHDGAWFAAALASAARATGDEFYKDVLDRCTLPFYCRMLNHSDTLFTAKQIHARPERVNHWNPNDEWMLREGEKGFVPYWWDDGASVSLERVWTKNRGPEFPCFDWFTANARENPKFLLKGYSLGSSNHMAQDLGVMLQVGWCLFRDDADARGRKWAAELAEAAKNLQQCRTNHRSPAIPAVLAPAALSAGDAKALARLPDPTSDKWWDVDNHYTRALDTFKPGQKYFSPGFADDQEYYYYAGIARCGGQLPRNLAFRLIYDAFTHPQLFRYYCDDQEPPPGINVFDLSPYPIVDGKFADYRSDKKGPFKQPRPIGSRFGPQNMVICGLALQALAQYPGIWEERYKARYASDLRVPMVENLAEGGAVPRAQVKIGRDVVALASTRGALHLIGNVEGASFSCRIFSRPDGQGSFAEVRIDKDGKIAVANDQGKPLVTLEGSMARARDGRLEFVASLPYMIMKGQGAWATGVEHQRYSIKLPATQINFYLASHEPEVKAFLQRELAMGLRAWEAIFNELGYIPTGIGEPRWQKFSDTGGYAHLLAAAAQWLNVLEGKKDWELHHIPAVK